MIINEDYEKYIIEFFDKQIMDNLFILGRGDKKITYNFVPMGFDIETYTNYQKDDRDKVIYHYTNMYIWQFSFGSNCFIGRTWEELHNLIELIKKYVTRGQYKTIVFIHNMSFEMSFFRNLLKWHSYQVFARKPRHPMKLVVDDDIIFLDSYLLTGFSLKKLAENYTTTQKLSGEDFNYYESRNSKTVLTDEQLKYCENDVMILSEYAQYYCNTYLSEYFLPMTSTMIANKVVKDKIKELKCYKEVSYLMMDIYPKTYNQYDYIMSFFTGAYTHGMLENLFHIHENALSYDVCSEYPYCLMNGYYPMSKFKVLHNMKLANKFLENFCCLCTVTYKNIKTKTGVTIISKHKAIKPINAKWDNGRLWKADSITVKVTELDIETLSMHYEYEEMIIENLLYSKRAPLPDYLLLTIAELYSKKCTLKGVAGAEIEYMQSKKDLNGQYGSLATRLSVTEIKVNEDGLWEELPKELDFDNIWKSKNKAPQWAVYCTAHARHLILSTVAKIKRDDYFYTDTDSIKCSDKKYIRDMFDQTNKKIRENNKVWIERLGLKEKYPTVDFAEMGTFDLEGKIDKIKVLGSKRYLCESKGKIHCTVAGLPVGTFEKYIKENNLDPFEQFSNNLFFQDDKSEKLCSYYMDEPKEFIVTDNQGNAETIHSESYVSLIPTTFSLDIDGMLLDLYNNINLEKLKYAQKGFIKK